MEPQPWTRLAAALALAAVIVARATDGCAADEAPAAAPDGQGATAPADPAGPPPAAADAPETEPYDPSSAWHQSLGYTLALVVVGGVVIAIDPPVGAVITGLGIAIGPSIGHFYIERWEHALGLSALRLGLAIAAGVCIVQAIERDPAWQRGLLAAGGAVAAAGTLALAVYDIAAVAGHAREANLEARRAAVAAAPIATGGGLVLAGRF